MSKTNAMMSGMGWATQFISKLTKRLRQKYGWSYEEIHALVTEEGEELLERGVEAFAEAVSLPGKVFRLTVDFDRSVEELVEAGGYYFANSNVTPENFPSDHSGTEDVNLHILTTEDLFGESRRATTEEVLEAMEALGFKPAGEVYGIKPLLALGAEYPDEQREAPIVDLGSAWRRPRGGRRVPVLWSSVGGRGLRLGWLGSRWRSVRRFAAVRA